ncbi:MAG: hypothetical protein ACW987_02845 [Candidatus Thorarchaeota archaeon]
MELHRTVTPEEWLKIGWDFLETMGVGELVGCDIDISTILERIPPGSDFIDVQTFLQHSVVETLLENLESGCSTILLDIDKMDGTPAAVLIPKILELRKKEMEMISIPVLGTELIVYDVYMKEIGVEIIPASGDSVLLRELWLTATGHELLSKFQFGLRTPITEFSQIQNEFKRYGIKYQLRRVSNETSLKPPRISNAMISIILSTLQKE